MENFYQALNKLLHIISESTRVIEIMNYDIVVICHIRLSLISGSFFLIAIDLQKVC